MSIKKVMLAGAGSVFSLLPPLSAAQQMVEIPFPATQQTSITDCTTPTVLDPGGGQKIMFEGGQFIHYSGLPSVAAASGANLPVTATLTLIPDTTLPGIPVAVSVTVANPNDEVNLIWHLDGTTASAAADFPARCGDSQ